LDVNHALGPHAIEFAPSRQAVCRCFDEMKAEGALDLMRETATSLRDCVRAAAFATSLRLRMNFGFCIVCFQKGPTNSDMDTRVPTHHYALHTHHKPPSILHEDVAFSRPSNLAPSTYPHKRQMTAS
jgi:hypothetical protein